MVPVLACQPGVFSPAQTQQALYLETARLEPTWLLKWESLVIIIIKLSLSCSIDFDSSPTRNRTGSERELKKAAIATAKAKVDLVLPSCLRLDFCRHRIQHNSSLNERRIKVSRNVNNWSIQNLLKTSRLELKQEPTVATTTTCFKLAQAGQLKSIEAETKSSWLEKSSQSESS